MNLVFSYFIQLLKGQFFFFFNRFRMPIYLYESLGESRSYVYEISGSRLLFRKVAILNIEELPLLFLFSFDW